MQLVAFGQTDTGKKRPHNEDCFLVDNQLQLYVVADGMGGHAAGEVASATAVDILVKELHTQSALIKSYRSHGPSDAREQILTTIEKSIQKACAIVFQKSQENKKQHGMGTTLSLMLIADSGAFIAHVGDSRIYLIRGGEVHQLTVDHTLINEQMKRGSLSKTDARKAVYKNVITRALGIQRQVSVDTLHLDVLPADRFLICSDGLHGYLRPGDVERTITSVQAPDIPKCFVELANKRGGRDNISVVLIEVAPDKESAVAELHQRIETLRNAPLFKYLNYRELVTLMNLTYIRTVGDGEIIVEESVAGDELFIIVHGEARVLKGGQEIARLPPGSHFGEMAILDNAPRSATITAVGTSRLLVMGRKQFYDYVRRDAAAGVKLLWSFLQILTLRLRSTDERLREARKELSEMVVKPEWIVAED